MPFLSRTGPKILILTSKEISKLHGYIVDDFNALECDINTAFERSTDGTTLLFLVGEDRGVIKVSDIEHIFLVEEIMEKVLLVGYKGRFNR